MKVGRVFLAGHSAFPEEGQRFIHSIPGVIRQEDADHTTPFMLYEAPIRSLQVPVFILQPLDRESGFYSTVLDISGQVCGNQNEVKERGVYLNESLVLDPAPWEWQKLVENSNRYWEPFLRSGAPFHQLREIWVKYPEVFSKYIDKRKNPTVVGRQNFYIILGWVAWEQQRVPQKVRIDSIEKAGFGRLTPKAFEKRVNRELKLPKLE